MKNIIVTGGCGFLGTNLCRLLLEQGHNVYAVDNFFTGTKENAEFLKQYKSFNVIEHDVIEPLKVDFAVDEIYHLACPASPPYYQKEPIFTAKTSFCGALNMLELAKEKNAKILLTSTSEIYGEPLVHPQVETYRGNVNTIGIRSCYDEGKRISETLFFDYWRMYDLKIKVVRIFNTYGPFMQIDDGRVVTNFIRQAIYGEDITIYGDGTQTRSFCYVDDLVSGLEKMMNSRDDFRGPVNLGNPGEFTMLELADMVLEYIDTKSKIVFRPLPSDDPTRRRPDITLASEELGWKPGVALREGLKNTIKYFQERGI
ncbi:MAG: SDR family oxidoreductase [Lentisphaeria bacterium]|nr:SDR family oxidoreductase [Lentisphaeria bacterium]